MRSLILISIGALVLGSSLTSLAAASDNWPRFRGPNGTGVSEDAIPIKWTDADFAWKTVLPGIGHSSPVVWGENVFVTSADEHEGKRSLICVDTRDGKIRWQHTVDLKPFKKHGDNSFASNTPAVDDKHVYVEWTTQDEFTVYAITHDGKEAWHTDLGAYRTAHGGGGSPVVVGDVVVVNVDQDKGQSFIAGLDRMTGQVRWKTPRASTKFSTSTPCLLGPLLVFATHASGFTAIDPVDGRVAWELPGAFADRVISSPVVAGDLILGTCGEGGRGKAVFAMKPPVMKDDKPSIVYTLKDEIPYVPTPIVHDGRLFTWSDSGTVSCHDPATGKQIWTGRVKAGFFGSPVCANGKLYCVSKRGDVAVVDATSDEYKLLAMNELGEASHATPAVANGRMYVRTLSQLISIRAADRTAAIERP